VIDVDQPGLLGDPRTKEGPVKGVPVHPPYLSVRHLAMVSVLAGNWPELTNPHTVFTVLKAEMNAIRKQLSIWKLTERPRTPREAPHKKPPAGALPS
jgi:hypothetical protein